MSRETSAARRNDSREPRPTYLGDDRIPMDNNEVEELMKQVAIGRKNWLSVGSVTAGERAADFLTLVGSAVRNDVDVSGPTPKSLKRPELCQRVRVIQLGANADGLLITMG